MEKQNKNSNGVNGQKRLKGPWREIMRRVWIDYQWGVIACLWILALVLGYVGFRQYFVAIGETRSFWDTLLRTLQLFVLESGFVEGPVNLSLQIARFLAPLVAVFTAIQALAAIFYEQIQVLRARFLSDHVIICGLGRKGFILAEEFCNRGFRVVVIEQNDKNSMLEQCRAKGAIVLIGNAADSGLLKRARAQKAKYLLSVCGDDGINSEVAVNARKLVEDRRGRVLTCLVQVIDLHLCNLLREQEIYGGRIDSFRLEFFNVFESGARELLDEFDPFEAPDSKEATTPHPLVIGLGRMGRSVVAHTARRWDARHGSSDKKLEISIIDRYAKDIKESLKLQYPRLEEVCDIKALQMDIESPEFERADFLVDSSGNTEVTTVYVCLDDDSRSLSAALTMLQPLRNSSVRIIVRMVHDAGLATLLEGEETGSGFDNLKAFGLLDRTCKPEQLLAGGIHEKMARAIHEEYVRLRTEAGQTVKTNPSLVPWYELPEDLKESNRCQADHIGMKLKAIGCGIRPLSDSEVEGFEFEQDEVELMARLEHERWRMEREGRGWLPSSGLKDLDRKTSPWLVSWYELPDEHKERNRSMVNKIPDILAVVGFQVYRFRE